MSIFDPLGFLSNLLISNKILLQAIWDSGIHWDDYITDDQFQIWKALCNSLNKINDFYIPRQLTTLSISHCNVQLHIFCDASKYAYASCAYLRFQCNSQIETTLYLTKKHFEKFNRSIFRSTNCLIYLNHFVEVHIPKLS